MPMMLFSISPLLIFFCFIFFDPRQIHSLWFFLFIAATTIGDWFRYRRLLRRNPANLELLEVLRKQEPDLESRLAGIDASSGYYPPEEHPLFEKWTHRLEKRALLWRVDRFLSGRSFQE